MHRPQELNGKTIQQAVIAGADEKLVIHFTDGYRLTISSSVRCNLDMRLVKYVKQS